RTRPGGNIAGVNSMSNELVAKRLGLLHELLRMATRFAVLVNPKNPTTESLKKDVEAAAATIGPQIEFFTASTGAEIDTAFASLVQKRADALLIHPDNLFINRRVQLTTLAARHAVPAMYPLRPDAEAGGLMSYGTKLADAHRQAGVYTGGSSKARSRRIYRSCSQPSSSSSSTCKRRKRSVSRCRRHCSPAP